jgi:CelD/BcsL family acetyltransferase involved in cellulose biosynthesis
MSGALATTTIRDTAALARLEPAWWDLLRRSPAATPFQSPAWLLPWWEAFHPGPLCTVAVHAGERLVALAPIYVERTGDCRRLLPLGISVSDYHDVLADESFMQVALAAIARHVAGLDEDWDAWILPELAPRAVANGLPWPAGAEDVQAGSPCPVLALDCDLDRAVPAHQRRKLRMARHRAARQGAFRVLETAEFAPERWLAELLALHGARWQSRGEAGVLADDDVTRFHALALPPLCGRGHARLYGLDTGGRIVGVYYGFHFAGRAYAYLGGFDPEFASVSPGTILIGHALAAAQREGAREFDFLRGAEAYKYRWGASDRPNRTRVLRRVP